MLSEVLSVSLVKFVILRGQICWNENDDAFSLFFFDDDVSYLQTCDFSGFFLISGFLYKSPFASILSCLWGCGESVNPPKLNIQQVQGALSSRPKRDTQDFFTFVRSHPCI